MYVARYHWSRQDKACHASCSRGDRRSRPSQTAVVMDSGLGATRRPGMTKDGLSVDQFHLQDRDGRRTKASIILVIPGRASWREPGIHNPESQLSSHTVEAWLWIPGSA